MDRSNQIALSTFGQWLMTEVRDSTIAHWRMMLSGQMKGKNSEEVQKILKDVEVNKRELLQPLIQKIVDTTLHYLLAGLEDSAAITLNQQLQSGEKINICEASDGLAGEVHGENGWIALFSSEES